jgi:hypothetical protein
VASLRSFMKSRPEGGGFMLAQSATRSEGAPEIHHEIEQEAKERTEWLAERPHLIDRRLRQLDEEWDIERAIEANAATLALVGTILSMTHDRRWSFLPLAVTGFLLQHATQGWCPPVPVLRSLGFRTQGEIDRERYALKAVRGDFEDLPGDRASGQTRGRQAFHAAH